MPLWEKYILTIQEAADYFHIGEKKQRKLVKKYDKKEKERIENKKVAQKKEPLYNDIHQIVGDLRFIKNLIIIDLVCGFILGIIGVLGLM